MRPRPVDAGNTAGVSLPVEAEGWAACRCFTDRPSLPSLWLNTGRQTQDRRILTHLATHSRVRCSLEGLTLVGEADTGQDSPPCDSL